MRYIQLCVDCRPAEGAPEGSRRVWEEVRCPSCRRFYCRNLSCMKPLGVSEHDRNITCPSCGTGHRFSGGGIGKICVDRPFNRPA